MEAPRACLSDLPEPIVLDIMGRPALCALAQTSELFLGLAGTESLWGGEACTPLLPGDRMTLAVRLCMFTALHLPPQVFSVQEDMGRRSNRFPFSVPTVNLRTLLSTPHADDVAKQAAARITDQIQKAAQERAFPSSEHVQVAPADMFSVARADGIRVRFALRVPAAAQVIMEGLEALGWPEGMLPTSWRKSSTQQDSSSKCRRSLLFLARGVLSAREAWPHLRCADWDRAPSKEAMWHKTKARWAVLRLAAAQASASLHLQGHFHQAWQQLSDWLGPLDEAGAQADSADLHLLMTARGIYQIPVHKLALATFSDALGVVDRCNALLQGLAVAVEQHTASISRPLFATEAPACKSSCSDHLKAMANLLRSQARGHMDPLLTAKAQLPPRARLKARVVLEALRVMEWAFDISGKPGGGPVAGLVHHKLSWVTL